MQRSLFWSALLLAVVLCFARAAEAQTPLSGHVFDDVTGEPIPLATVVISGTTDGTACDDAGAFVLLLPANEHMLRVSALGYTSKTVHVTGEIRDLGRLDVRLKPSVLNFDEVVVNARASVVSDPAASLHNQNATEDMLDRLPGADFIQRANFAWEPVIRGMSGGQVGVVIDGIKVIGACIDRMDPTSAYVEVENLDRLELSKGGFDLNEGSQIGGSVNMVTEKPSFSHPYQLSTEFGFESASMLRRGRVVGGMSAGNTAVRASFSHRAADDFSPGGRAPIANSGYRKTNYKIDVAQRLFGKHTVTASFLSDDAWGVGYPVLLMDATLAKARIYSLTHNFAPGARSLLESLETRFYYNTVDHWMDDYKRDVLERRVMRGMNMPMFGKTRTAGAISKAGIGRGSRHLGLTLDYYQTKSFADMWMFSVYENIPDMYLLNLGDVVVRNGALSADYTMPVVRRLTLRLNARFDWSRRGVDDPRARGVLKGDWDTEDINRTYAFPSFSATLEYAATPVTRLRLSLARVARLPTRIENYGHYVYNYVDGYFYTGNPNLDPEHSSQVELGLEHLTTRYGFRATAFVNFIQDYILGLPDENLSISSDTYRFRYYRNLSGARLFGFEFSGFADIGSGLSVSGTASYTNGENLEIHEPMYLISPLAGTAGLRYDGSRFWAELETRMAMPQNRVATLAANEDPTDGYFTVNARGSVPLSRGISLKVGVENLLDAYYHEHLSIGNLPDEGRNFYASISYAIH